MFQFTRFPLHILFFQIWVTKHYSGRISPFGNSWIKAFVQLPKTFRRLHVLHRYLVPRHSSSALFSLLYAALIELLDALLVSLCGFQRTSSSSENCAKIALQRPSLSVSLFVFSTQRQTEMIPAGIPNVNTWLTFLWKKMLLGFLTRLVSFGCQAFSR